MYPSPMEFKSYPDSLFRNNGDGTFTDVSAESGVGKPAGPGMGTVCADFDNDGDTDIFVGNDLAANYLFVNDGHGKFSEMGLLTGTAHDIDGRSQGTMGAACGDFDHYGRLDL